MNLDILAGLLCGWLALCAFTLHVVSSPHRRAWMNIPEYVRGGFILTGVMFTWRSVNFITVSGAPAVLGRINAEGMMALLALTYLVSALAYWVFTAVLPNRWWERIEWLKRMAVDRPDAAPVILEGHEVVNTTRAVGFQATEPGEGGEAVIRELQRRKVSR